LSAAGADDPVLGEGDVPAAELVAWFCEERLRRPVPTDVEELAGELGFSSAEALYRALLRERLYVAIGANRRDSD